MVTDRLGFRVTVDYTFREIIYSLTQTETNEVQNLVNTMRIIVQRP